VSAANDSADALLAIHGLSVQYAVREGLFQRTVGAVRAVEAVDLTIAAGETFGLVGESGSGKSTLAKAVLGLAPVSSGSIHLAGRALPRRIGDRPAELRRAVQIVFQDVSTALNPRRSVGAAIEDPMLINRTLARRDRHARVRRLLEMVELPTDFVGRYPHELSGGERQRVGIARALALEPRLIVLDEPTSSLDVSVQAKVADLLAQLQRTLGLTYLLISHDLALVRNLATRVGVMYLGRLMEVAPAAELFDAPHNPYTACLLTAVPTVDMSGVQQASSGKGLRVLPGDVPSPRNPPSGCVFHTRCPMRQPICAQQEPPLRRVASGWYLRCHFDVQTDAPTVDPTG